ncbi:MAG TPA: alpha/beta hydrolase-fold protein [Pirellulaceae bacterium]|nr:alpha/beta hydrolase-fold protein [Pirellulaceae bacterium]HMO92154.1 alpha/beta hydrolase-fold protein [Pirellulaceae bacterium]HMP68920.1 alpha/beta hydrolase-fold protein [Pirellulaceae bacterium]
MISSVVAKILPAGATPEAIKHFIESHQFPIVENNTVTFVFVGEAQQVELRHWIYGLPSSIPLARLERTNVWYRTVEFPLGSRIEYKFGVTRSGHNQWIHDPLNPNIAHDPFGGNSVVHSCGYRIPEWSYHNEQSRSGHLIDLEIPSRAFGDARKIRVYVPAKYRDYRRYRLVIVHDGDDYLRYSSLKNVLDNLIHRLEIPQLIVALTNPGNRLQEYADDPRHADHLVNEVLPTLETRFPLITDPAGRCLAGASFGGVASLATAWRYPGVFGSLLLQSGSFAFTDIGDHNRSPAFDPVVKFMNQFRRNPGDFTKRIFLSCGVYESLIYENRSMYAFLNQLGIDTKFSEAFDGHNWENWRDRLRDALSWLYPGPLWVTYM